MRLNWLTGALSLIGLTMLAGCAAPPPPPPPPSPTASIDGRYSGTASGSCGTAQATGTIADGQFTLALASGETLQGSVGPRGSLRATTVDVTGRSMNFTGHIDGQDLRGGSYNGRCALAFSLSRRA